MDDRAKRGDEVARPRGFINMKEIVFRVRDGFTECEVTFDSTVSGIPSGRRIRRFSTEHNIVGICLEWLDARCRFLAWESPTTIIRPH